MIIYTIFTNANTGSGTIMSIYLPANAARDGLHNIIIYNIYFVMIIFTQLNTQ